VTPEQLSVALTTYGTFASHAPPTAVTVMLLGQEVNAGGVVSFTVNVVVHVEVFPAASFAVIVTVVGPRPTSVPAVGLCVKVIEPAAVQLSVAAAEPVRSGTAAWHEALAEPVWGAGHVVMLGGVTSLIVNVVVQVE